MLLACGMHKLIDSYLYNLISVAKKDHLPFMELNSPGSMNNAIPASISTPDLNLLREFSNQSQSSHLTREEEKVVALLFCKFFQCECSL